MDMTFIKLVWTSGFFLSIQNDSHDSISDFLLIHIKKDGFIMDWSVLSANVFQHIELDMIASRQP